MPSPRTPSQLPAALGYRMPAEWEPHAATWIAWPHNRSDWPGKFETIPWIYAEIIRHLARVERVNILVENETAEAKARALLVHAHVLPERAADPGKSAGNIQFVSMRTNRVWTRDYWPDLRSPGLTKTGARRCGHRMALQRLGQVQRLEA